MRGKKLSNRICETIIPQARRGLPTTSESFAKYHNADHERASDIVKTKRYRFHFDGVSHEQIEISKLWRKVYIADHRSANRLIMALSLVT
jgi:hypothetical protein